MFMNDMKCRRDVYDMKNRIFSVSCGMCDFKHVCSTGQFDFRRTIARKLTDELSEIQKHYAKCPLHELKKPKVKKVFYRRKDIACSQHVIRWMADD